MRFLHSFFVKEITVLNSKVELWKQYNETEHHAMARDVVLTLKSRLKAGLVRLTYFFRYRS